MSLATESNKYNQINKITRINGQRYNMKSNNDMFTLIDKK